MFAFESGPLTFVENIFKSQTTVSKLTTLYFAIDDLHRTGNLPKPLDKVNPTVEQLAWFYTQAVAQLGMTDGLRRELAKYKGISPNDTVPEDHPGKQLARQQCEIQMAIEASNRLPNGSVRILKEEDFQHMSDLIGSYEILVELARRGVELLQNNSVFKGLGTLARGLPAGGAGTRAKSYLRRHPEIKLATGWNEDMSRLVYDINGKSLLQLTIENGKMVGDALGVVFPTFIMSSREVIREILNALSHSSMMTWSKEWLDNIMIFNQPEMERVYLQDREITDEKYPLGHGDYPYLLSEYGLIQEMHKAGIKYFLFSNGDEFMWSVDPVMIAIAQKLFDEGYEMLAIGVTNANGQFGGGFVEDAQDGRRYLVETPRLPADIIEASKGKDAKPPDAINTTFYIMSVEAMAKHLEELQKADKSLVVKTVPGRKELGIEMDLTLGADSWAGDTFTKAMKSAFIWWPRTNFLGIKDASHLVGTWAEESLGGMSYSEYTKRAAAIFPAILRGIVSGDEKILKQLLQYSYEYIKVQPG